MPFWANGLDDPVAEVRGWCALKLGQMGDTRAIPVLIEALQLKDECEIELAPIRDIGIADYRGIPMYDSPPAAWAGDILCRLGEPALAPLLDLVHHENPLVRQNAAFTLGRMGDTRVVPALRRLLNDTTMAKLWEPRTVSDVVADALKHINTPEAHAALAEWQASLENDK